MNESITPTEGHFTACASLAALGVHLSRLNLFGPIREEVSIAQKTVTHSPTDKLYDVFISLLAGAHGLVEINSRLRGCVKSFQRPIHTSCELAVQADLHMGEHIFSHSL